MRGRDGNSKRCNLLDVWLPRSSMKTLRSDEEMFLALRTASSFVPLWLKRAKRERRIYSRCMKRVWRCVHKNIVCTQHTFATSLTTKRQKVSSFGLLETRQTVNQLMTKKVTRRAALFSARARARASICGNHNVAARGKNQLCQIIYCLYVFDAICLQSHSETLQ
jgi:hypothetical protein